MGDKHMINVLDRITYFKNQRNWSEYQLAEKSGLTQSTISTWYRKNIIPSLPSLEKICKAFDITLSQFFSTEADDTFSLTPVQRELLIEGSRFSEEQLLALIQFFKTLE